MDCSTPGFPVLHHLLELTQTHVHRVGIVPCNKHRNFLPHIPVSEDGLYYLRASGLKFGLVTAILTDGDKVYIFESPLRQSS